MTDAPLDAGRRDGDVVAVHLRDALVLDGTTLAPAGAKAVLLVSRSVTASGKRVESVSLERFSVSAGLLPVRAVDPIVPPVPAGAVIEARTLAEVDHLGDRYSIRTPFPFRLSGDQPASAYTPTPARTAPPFARPGGPPPTRPTPAPSSPPMPSPTAPPPP
ncbi:MAG: hypothetical protein JO036_08470 [Candidatus Eremiobacteraeota bacterium]|nr:hypothetical protein [Candidatus Eremiobacteraeota bacterium]